MCTSTLDGLDAVRGHRPSRYKTGLRLATHRIPYIYIYVYICMYMIDGTVLGGALRVRVHPAHVILTRILGLRIGPNLHANLRPVDHLAVPVRWAVTYPLR